ncbi:TIGR03960 family B12-binding radical SAM protein [Calditerrivibrio nitroreducens]|uniref:Radical SAM domain protein n=1 Tax=Calditerrivibrio nitroreducens (strain DSM 19672 / NBRC 101217 / Yu37-1) TaxID=768670 RepID=E4TEF4_CALNY|nr:TIGR03960 family B12-binding radical SAM protein [Calditerrivibrio nitroreducens]ADR18280.1 Radical SAM domain protein [Calditerrivibrio nitroreducens DSM 19672]
MTDFIKRLTMVSKPVRYINNEINSIHKKINDGMVKVCLAFPDTYEIGMSHLGMKILYESLNSSDKIVAERFFVPWMDAITIMGEDLFVSLESKIPLNRFDILGFSLQYELSYSNIILTLKYSKIPFWSSERSENDPIIVAGGPCVFNPAPLNRIVDAFFVGEMDDEFRKVLEGVLKFKRRKDRLEYLNSFPFVYVPIIDYNKIVKRNIFTEFSHKTNLKSQIVPLMPVVQDRVSIEISRGCTRGCRFCQAGVIYRPSREQNVEKIISDGLSLLNKTGYNEISLMSLSASDYTRISDLLLSLSELVKNDKISLSLPSLRVDKIDDFIFESLSKVRKSGFTIAPEAGSQRMRDIINKNISEDEIFTAVERAQKNGWSSAKLYFMVGLPFETDDDVAEIAELVKRLKLNFRGKNSIDITASVSNFVPKPFTPFQWYPQNRREDFLRKHNMLKDLFKRYKINFKIHNIDQSVMEGVFSRGDNRLNDLIIKAVESGCCFDGWSEYFDMSKWRETFDDFGYSVEEFACKEYKYDDILPWDNIDPLVSKEFLWEEYQKSSSGILIPDCKTERCTGCGVCDFDKIQNIKADRFDIEINTEIDNSKEINYSVIFTKKGFSSILSALELSRVFSHTFNIIGYRLSYSKGFNPQPRINYVYPLPVGVEGENEILLIRGDEITDMNNFMKRLKGILPDGLVVKDIRKITKYDQGDADVIYRFEKDDYRFLKSFYERGEAYYIKKSKKGDDKIINIDQYLPRFNDNKLTISLKISNMGGYNPLDFFKYTNYNYNKIVREKIILKGLEYV